MIVVLHGTLQTELVVQICVHSRPPTGVTGPPAGMVYDRHVVAATRGVQLDSATVDFQGAHATIVPSTEDRVRLVLIDTYQNICLGHCQGRVPELVCKVQNGMVRRHPSIQIYQKLNAWHRRESNQAVGGIQPTHWVIPMWPINHL